ncbi:hypothetical protein ACVIVD_000001, partial [Bradyrhizobium liaoningense]
SRTVYVRSISIIDQATGTIKVSLRPGRLVGLA